MRERKGGVNQREKQVNHAAAGGERGDADHGLWAG